MRSIHAVPLRLFREVVVIGKLCCKKQEKDYIESILTCKAAMQEIEWHMVQLSHVVVSHVQWYRFWSWFSFNVSWIISTWQFISVDWFSFSVKCTIIHCAKLIPGHDNAYVRKWISVDSPLNIMYLYSLYTKISWRAFPLRSHNLFFSLDAATFYFCPGPPCHIFIFPPQDLKMNSPWGEPTLYIESMYVFWHLYALWCFTCSIHDNHLSLNCRESLPLCHTMVQFSSSPI